jgi:hypothetical protein
MPLFVATVKSNVFQNGVRVEKGMSVEFSCSSVTPFNNGGHDIIDAFMRKYGLDIKKADALSAAFIDVKRIN